ncbi:hypothetical protein LCGC14_2952700 [marine sediment metagenome]|uniref:Uncharacterized protein n=1 Tax=marine sediment metagenome TaxID=412755 RepID=A0A0F9A5Y6_9ZZZZ
MKTLLTFLPHMAAFDSCFPLIERLAHRVARSTRLQSVEIRDNRIPGGLEIAGGQAWNYGLGRPDRAGRRHPGLRCDRSVKLVFPGSTATEIGRLPVS